MRKTRILEREKSLGWVRGVAGCCYVLAMLVMITGCPVAPTDPCTGFDADDGDACTVDTCEVVDGGAAVVNTPLECEEGFECDPNTGECVETIHLCAGVVCDDDNNCTDDGCDSDTGECVYTENAVECDDGDACTEVDVCGSGSCAGTETDCDDDDLCTEEECVDGECVYTDVECDEGYECSAETGNCEEIVVTQCTDDTECDDLVDCTDDACVDEVCTFTDNCPSGTVCDQATRTCAECETDAECGEGEECVDGDCAPVLADRVLASYEQSETANLLVSSPDDGMTITWPVQGGTAGAPRATEGSHVLKMTWAGETDGKVEITHDWAGSTFHLAGYAEIRADVYISAGSALPEIVGIWDDVIGWIEGVPVPTTTNEWVTISMYVGHLEHMRLDHIHALLFEQLAGNDGTIYVDNLRLISASQISFAGSIWTVESGYRLKPGPNHFSDSTENVSVDENGYLHLRITESDGVWYCSEVVANDSLGFGTYVFTIESRVDVLDDNIILGLFTWDTSAPQYNYREIDFEFGRWRDPEDDNAQYAIQPWNAPGNLHRFNIDYSGRTETTTHVMTWKSDGIYFTSYYGGFSMDPPEENIIATWSYTGSDNPPAEGGNIRMNFWLVDGVPPANGENAEVVITGFQYRTAVSVRLAD